MLTTDLLTVHSLSTYNCFRVLIHIVSLGNVKWPVLQSAKQQTFSVQKYVRLNIHLYRKYLDEELAKATGQLLINNVQTISLMSIQTLSYPDNTSAHVSKSYFTHYFLKSILPNILKSYLRRCHSKKARPTIANVT